MGAEKGGAGRLLAPGLYPFFAMLFFRAAPQPTERLGEANKYWGNTTYRTLPHEWPAFNTTGSIYCNIRFWLLRLVCRVRHITLTNEDFIQNNRSVSEIDSLFDSHSLFWCKGWTFTTGKPQHLARAPKGIPPFHKTTRRPQTSTVRHAPKHPSNHAPVHADHTARTPCPASELTLWSSLLSPE